MSNASLATGATAAVDASARQQPTNAPAEGEFTVTVYASSSSVVAESYCTASYALGKAMAARGWVQVNGGGGGLMGECTSGAVDAGGVVECVILRQFLANKAKAPFRRVLVLDSMVDRRAGLYESANAFGTLDRVIHAKAG